MPMHGEDAGAARVRRERRMRSFWRHEQMAIQMVLASVQHHSHGAPRGQTTAVEVPTDSAYALGATISSALRRGLQGFLPRSSSWTPVAYAGGQAGDYDVHDEYFKYDDVL